MNIEEIKKYCDESGHKALKKYAEQLNPCLSIRDRIEHDLNEDPPVQVVKGNIFREGVSDELDELRNLAHSGKDYLEKIRDLLDLSRDNLEVSDRSGAYA